MKTGVNIQKYEIKENKCRKNIGKDIKVKERRKRRKKEANV